MKMIEDFDICFSFSDVVIYLFFQVCQKVNVI